MPSMMYLVPFLLLTSQVSAFVSSSLQSLQSVVHVEQIRWTSSPISIKSISIDSNRSSNRIVSARTRLFNQPLATEGDWSAYLDTDKTGFVYYFNALTGESLWEKPTPSFPNVNLQGETRRVAIQKQEAYLKSINNDESATATNKARGFLQALLDKPAAADADQIVKKEDALQQQQQPSKETTKGGWFGNTGGNKDDTNEESAKWFNFFAEPKIDEAISTATSTTIGEKSKQEPEKSSLGLFGDMLKSISATINNPNESGKAQEIVTSPSTDVAPIAIQSAAYVLPHPAKVRWGGEDAVFTKGRTFGVFDGVSGAEKRDGVPLYSKTLADQMKRLIQSEEESLTTTDLIQRLTQCATTADETATGASTAVVASIGNDGFLRALNLGDSACMVIRNDKIVAKTREISHYFECPYQLSVDSPDRPRDGTKLNVELQRGDYILMASDGIFDNLSDTEIVDIVGKEKALATKAKRLSEISRKVSLNDNAETPYAKLAKRYGDPDFADGRGGKVDDVSCIIVSYK